MVGVPLGGMEHRVTYVPDVLFQYFLSEHQVLLLEAYQLGKSQQEQDASEACLLRP